jgi:hypothetical protein
VGYYAQHGLSANSGITSGSPKRYAHEARAVDGGSDSPTGTATLVGTWLSERITTIPASTTLKQVPGAYMDDQRVLTGNTAGDTSGGMIESANDSITVDGLDIRNCRSQALNLQGANVTIRNNWIRGTWLHGIFALGKNVTITDNQVDDPAMDNYSNRRGAWAGGIAVHGDFYRATGKNRGTGHQVLSRNIVRRSWGEGIAMLLCDFVTIEDCFNYESWATGIYFDGISGTSGDRSVIRRCFSAMRAAGSYNSVPLSVGSENAGSYRGVTEVAVAYCDVISSIGVAGGHYAWQGADNNLSMHHCRWLGNTFYGGIMTRETRAVAPADNEIRGNIFNGLGGVWRLDQPSGYTIDENVFYNFSGLYAGSSFGTNSSTSNPLFVNAGGHDPADYQLQPSSPAKGMIPAITGLTYDYDNVTRVSPDDAGAWGANTGDPEPDPGGGGGDVVLPTSALVYVFGSIGTGNTVLVEGRIGSGSYTTLATWTATTFNWLSASALALITSQANLDGLQVRFTVQGSGTGTHFRAAFVRLEVPGEAVQRLRPNATISNQWNLSDGALTVHEHLDDPGLETEGTAFLNGANDDNKFIAESNATETVEIGFGTFTLPASEDEPPTTTILTGPGATTDDTTPTFTFESDDPAATFEVRVDAGAWTATASGGTATTYTTGTLASGAHTFEVRATADGLTDATPATASFTVDPAPPVTAAGVYVVVGGVKLLVTLDT